MSKSIENQTSSLDRHGVLVFATLVLCASFGEVATGLIVPAMPALGEIFQRSPGTIQLTIVSFAVMFAVGQLFFGPFSDRRGRRTALLIGAALTLSGSVMAAMSDGIWMIVLGRAVQGLGGASGYVPCPASSAPHRRTGGHGDRIRCFHRSRELPHIGPRFCLRQVAHRFTHLRCPECQASSGTA